MEIMERTTRRFRRPEFGISEVKIDQSEVRNRRGNDLEPGLLPAPAFHRRAISSQDKPLPKLLIVAPMSGHFATLLQRHGCQRCFRFAEVYVTDWIDAREVPLAQGQFDLGDYIDYLFAMLGVLGPEPMSWPCASPRCRCSPPWR